MPKTSVTVNGEEVTFSKSDVEEAFDRTDESLDDENFEMRYSPWHFVEFDGERKPLKWVFLNIEQVSEVADSRQAFSTPEAESVLEELDVPLYSRKEDAESILLDTFEEILMDYPDREGKATKDKRLYQLLVNKAPNFVKHISNKSFEEGNFNFDGTAGQSNWPKIPWVAVLHPDETDTTQKGVYVVYLIDPVNEVVYATLNQGTKELKDQHGKPGAREILEDRAEQIRENIKLNGFDAENPDLSDNSKLYEEATIYQKKYKLGDMPSTKKIRSDLSELLKAYQSYVNLDEENGQKDIDSKKGLEIALSKSLLAGKGLYYPGKQDKQIVSQIESALNTGKHVIFTGPPGTGKTEIAEAVASELEDGEENVTGYQMTTATADWSTFDTVGGFMPEKNSEEGNLEFSAGQVLKRFRENGSQENEVLVIDEINRSDIDKAFGQLFTLLSGQEIQLPYTAENEQEIEVIPGGNDNAPETPDDHQYVMPESWRILATMNSYDKTSLYEMSYAFMRRFAFIRVEAPEDIDKDLVSKYNEKWEIDADESDLSAVADIWERTNSHDGRKIGPAIAEDMLGFVARSESDRAYTDAVVNFVFPQLEGVRNNGDIVKEIAKSEHVEETRLRSVARDMLQVKFDEEN